MRANRKQINFALSMLERAGLLRLLAQADTQRLTVLSYHRVDEPYRPGFDSFRPNVSATPGAFQQQMQHISRNYHTISCQQLSAWLRGELQIPARAAMITFDDGYCDNLEHAYPVLRKLGLPATIFLSTDKVGSDIPFDWDRAAYCFAHTRVHSAVLPWSGKRSWVDETDRDDVLRNWFELAKRMPEREMSAALDALELALGVSIPSGAFSGLYLDWDQVRELSRNGIEMGSHSASHAILTGIPPGQAEREIAQSKQRIEAETGKRVTSLAYPNGRTGDFSEHLMTILRQAGIETAFTLLPGPTRYSTVQKAPLAIRRIFLTHADGWARFAAKLAGLARLTGK